MAKNSPIEWTHHTFNPWWGCQKVSPACTHCYAEAWSKRIGLSVWGPSSDRRFFGDRHWRQPLLWNDEAARSGERRRVFCASMADVFETRDDLATWRERLWSLIEATPRLDWLLLTKRPENVSSIVPWGDAWPESVWLGTTVETQDWAAPRIAALLENKARIHFLSCEPLLGLLDLSPWLPKLDWVIAGGESGARARPMHPAWARALRDQCVDAGVAFHFKQWGSWAPAREGTGVRAVKVHFEAADATILARVGKGAAGRQLDGRTWSELPA